MNLRFQDDFFSKEERFSLGTDLETGKKYLSIPVFNGLIEYEEYYSIDFEVYKALMADASQAKILVEKCKNREMDNDLIIKPGRLRGSPC